MVETKAFDAQDVVGLNWAYQAGILTGVISGRDSPRIVARAKTLRFSYVYQGHLAKVVSYEEILTQAGLSDERAAFVGAGAVCEVVELLLKAQDKWPAILEKYRLAPVPGRRQRCEKG